jgi:UDP-2-acetamido-3-amino-2,3-dideoxy-glucuronate N-acetyltransferase
MIEPSAIVETNEIGEGTNIWHFTHVCAGARIGDNCVLGQNCYVAPTAIIGNGCKIQNNVSIYDGVVLEDNVFVGPSVVFTNVKNPRAFINRKNEYTKTIVKTGATIGANSTIVCGVTIGKNSFVAAGSIVTKDVPPSMMVMSKCAAEVVGLVNMEGYYSTGGME